MSSVIVAARCDHRRSAAVLDAIGVGVDELVQLRRSTQRKRPEKPCGNERRDQSAPPIT